MCCLLERTLSQSTQMMKMVALITWEHLRISLRFLKWLRTISNNLEQPREIINSMLSKLSKSWSTSIMNLSPNSNERLLSKSTVMSSKRKIMRTKKKTKKLTRNLSKLTSIVSSACLRRSKLTIKRTLTILRSSRIIKISGKFSSKQLMNWQNHTKQQWKLLTRRNQSK